MDDPVTQSGKPFGKVGATSQHGFPTLVKFAIQYTRRAIQKKAKFNIMSLNTIKGDKNIIKFEGDHNSPRPQFYFDSINIFFHNVLQPPEDEVVETFFDTLARPLGSLRSVHTADYDHGCSTAVTEEQLPWDTPDSLNLSQKDDQPDDASTAEKLELLEAQSTSTSVGHLGSLKTESISTSVSKSHDSRPEDQTRTRVPSTEPASQTPLYP
ncbi:hypothetical protein C1H46_030463 [Malus baccata]|uniref:Uncharacterized protein n=1 Tax=Malus baccata TaxID=106549 RepID=A0A540LC15_MALBA|nr:hypothetical protein C1H46_030463 [Malus baccata]